MPKVVSCWSSVAPSNENSNDSGDHRSQRLHVYNYIAKHESKLEDFERRYQLEMNMFEQNLTSETDDKRRILTKSLDTYISHRNDQRQREIFYKISFFRSRMSRRCRRHYRSASISSKISDVIFPQVIVDAPNIPLNKVELAYLSRGKICSIQIDHTYV